ncbi:MAG: sulfatase-like hydrolase/transferase [Acidobacteria bacterium]|nr:sulfatase-like hydrolase/transferase [Acidobacteriota bacterium]
MTKTKHPNILLITVDEMRAPNNAPHGGDGVIQEIAKIVGFAPDEELAGNAFVKYFPGLMALRRNAVALHHHTIASAACVPSRASIYTGQYASRTGVTQTDGIFKDPNDSLYPWLAPNGTPTLGDWFRAAGYSTHYFGKWHISNPTVGSLQPWGFGEWELSLPEGQGNGPGNLGIYRDISFTDLVTTFLDRKALGSQYEVMRSGSNLAYPNNPVARKHFVDEEPPPWLAVASFVNPHDITGWPRPWRGGPYGTQPKSLAEELTPPTVPEPGARSNPPKGGTKQVELNPDGLPSHLFNFTDDLKAELDVLFNTKPRAQYESAYKVGLGFKSQWPDMAPFGYNIRDTCPLPFQLLPETASADARQWFEVYGSYYVYFYYLVDLQLRRLMDCLDSSGLRDNTIIVFLSDHGEHGGAHGGMIEKWFSAYQEVIHVPCVVASPLINEDETLRHVTELTSHIDIAPTLLGLAGYDAEARKQIANTMLGKKVFDLPGADLSALLKDPTASLPVIEPDGESRRAVLFVTDDDITSPLSNDYGDDSYRYFCDNIEALRELINTDADQLPPGVQREFLPKALAPGSVAQPNHVQCVRTTEWRLARYWDPSGQESDQWEMYDMETDIRERINLVSWQNGQPVLNDKGKAHPKAAAALPALLRLLNQKLQAAGYPEPFLHTVNWSR